MSGWEKSAITLAVFLPALGAIVIAFVPSRRDRLVRGLGIVFSGAALAVGVIMLFGFDFDPWQSLPVLVLGVLMGLLGLGAARHLQDFVNKRRG